MKINRTVVHTSIKAVTGIEDLMSSYLMHNKNISYRIFENVTVK